MKTGVNKYFLRPVTVLMIVVMIFVPLLQAAAQDSVLTVDAADSQGDISPYLYGANYGGYGTLPPDRFEIAKESGIKFFRFPGGSIFDKDGNPLPMLLLDLFMTINNMVGAEPSIQARLWGGTPEEAAELVKYVNIDKGHGVRYWFVGNEPNLYSETYTVDDFNKEWREIAEAMLAVDPDIILVGPELSQYPGIAEQNPKDANGKDWLDEFLKVNGDLVDIISVHRYPFPAGMNSITSIEDLRNNPKEWELIVPMIRERTEAITGEVKPVAVTEINSHWAQVTGGEASPDSHYNAIWFADVMGRMIRQQVQIAVYFDFYGAGGRALNLVGPYEVRPTFYTYALYAQFGTELVSASAEDDLVTIYAAKREDGSLTLMIVNLADDEQSRTLSLQNFEISGDAEVYRLDSETNSELIGTETLTDGTTLTLPGQSATVYVIPGS